MISLLSGTQRGNKCKRIDWENNIPSSINVT